MSMLPGWNLWDGLYVVLEKCWIEWNVSLLWCYKTEFFFEINLVGILSAGVNRGRGRIIAWKIYKGETRQSGVFWLFGLLFFFLRGGGGLCVFDRFILIARILYHENIKLWIFKSYYYSSAPNSGWWWIKQTLRQETKPLTLSLTMRLWR